MPYHSIFLQRAVRAGPLLVRPPCVLFLRHGLLSPSVFLVVILLWYPHGFLLPVAESLPHADGNEFLPDSRRALKRRVSPTGVQAFSENTEPDASPSSLHMRRHVGDRGSRSVEQKTETPGKSRVQQASISGASKQHEGKERNFLSYTDRTSGQEKAKKTLEAADTATARDVRLLADGTPPLLANNVLSVSTILGQQDTEVTCPGKKVISLAALFREGDAAGILKFLVDGSLDFSRWPSPQNGYGAGVTGVSAAAKAENPREEEPEKRAPRRAAAGTGSLPSQQPCEAEIQAGSVNEFPQKQGSNGDLGESGCQLGDSTGEERQEEPRLFSDAGSEVSPAADVHDSQRSRANSPGRVYQRADPPPTGEVESRKEENTGSNGAEDPAAGNDEERLQETKKEELMAVNRFLHTSAKSLLESPLASKGLNLGDLVCRALSHPLVGTASFCSVLEVIRMQVVCKDRSLNCSAIEAALSNYFRMYSESSSGGAGRFSYPEITVPRVLGIPRDAVLDLPMHSELSSEVDSGEDIPRHIVEAEGPTYSLIWQGLQRLYDYYDAASCKLQFAVDAAPDPLPGWTTEMVIHAVQPGSTPRSPLCLVARRGKTVLVLIRGTQTEFEWSLNAQYQLTFGWLDRWDGQVESGFSRVFAAMAPAIQVYLGILQKQGLLDRIIVSGHSLGAAVGCLLSYSLAVSYRNVDAVLFAPPRSGDHMFMEAWRRRVNGRAIKYELDPYPEVPCPRMPVCEFSGKHRAGGGGLAAAGLGERARGLGQLMNSLIGTPTSRSSAGGIRESDPGYLSYPDYPNSVVFGPKDLPNPQVQSPFHTKYNHSCAYTCWLAHNFNPSDPRTMCLKGKAGHTPASENYSPSRCPSLN